MAEQENKTFMKAILRSSKQPTEQQLQKLQQLRLQVSHQAAQAHQHLHTAHQAVQEHQQLFHMQHSLSAIHMYMVVQALQMVLTVQDL